MAGTRLVVECRAEGGNPPPALRWVVGGVPSDGAEEQINTKTGVTVSQLALSVTRSDQGRDVVCEAVHPALAETLGVRAVLQVQCKSEHDVCHTTS